MVSADDYGIDFTGATDVRVALAAAINAQSPGTTFTLHADGLYLTTHDFPLTITAPGVTIDGLGASLFRNQRRTAPAQTTPHDNILTISANDTTIRNLKIYGFRKDEYLGSVLTTVAGSPTVNGTTIELNALNEEVRLPKVGLDIDATINLPPNAVSTHPHPFTNYETPFYFRQVDGLLKFEAVLSDDNHVASDCVFAIVNDLTDAVIYSQTYTLSGTPTLKTITFDPTSTYLGTPMRITIRKATATANTITVTSVTPYGEIGYRDRDMTGTYGFFTGGQEFSDAISVSAVSGTLLEDLDIEGPDGDCINCVDQDTNTVIRRITGRGPGRQGIVMHRGIDTLVEDCTIRETGRSGLDPEPNNATSLMTNGIIRRIEFMNIRNYAMSMRHWAKILDFTISDITVTNAGMGPWYGGGRNMVATNIVHSGTTRTEADRIDNGGVDPALNGGAGADAQIFGSNMEITGFTTELGFQLPVITNNYDDGGGVVTYSPDDIHVHDAVVTAPYTSPYVYIAATNSTVEFSTGGTNAFQTGGGLFVDNSPVVFAFSIAETFAQTLTLPGPVEIAGAFQQDVFDDPAFQMAAAADGIALTTTVFDPVVTLTTSTAQIVDLSGEGGWDSDIVVWDDPVHYWDEPNIGGFINQGGVVFAPEVEFRLTLGLIDNAGVVFEPSLGILQSVSLPLINQAGFVFTPQQFTQQIVMPEALYTTEVFEPSMAFEQTVTLDLIDQSPVLYEWQTGVQELDLPFIDQLGFTFTPQQFSFSVTPALIDSAGVTFDMDINSVVIIAPIDSTGTTFDIEVVFNLADVELDLIDNAAELFDPEIVGHFPQTVRFDDVDAGFIDNVGELLDLVFVPSLPQSIILGFIDQQGHLLDLRVYTATRPTITLHARYDPVSVKHARYDPVTLKHAQNSRQG